MDSTTANSIDIIDLLRSKPFVHIISEPRSGSTALYTALKKPTQYFDLNEPFDQAREVTGKKEQNNVKDHILTILKKDMEFHSVMKNHAFAILDLTDNMQERLWQIPAFTVGLTRRDWFAQTCSLALAEYTGKWDEQHKSSVTIPLDFFVDKFRQLLGCKNDLSQLDSHFNMLINYEDIKFPNKLDHKKVNSTLSIANIQELKQMYNHLKDTHQKYWRIRDTQ